MVYFFVFLFFLILINAYMTYFLCALDELEFGQKVSQIILVWVFPLVSSMGLIFFYKDQLKHKGKSRKFNAGESSSIDVSTSARDGDH